MFKFVIKIPVKESISRALNRLRLSNSLKMKEVEAQTGIDQALLSKFERAGRIPTDAQIEALALCYKVDFKYLKALCLAEKIYQLLEDEALAEEAWYLAEPRIQYLTRSNAKNTLHLPQSTVAGLAALDKLRAEWLSLPGLETTRLQKLEEYFAVQYTYESNKIEGNSLSLGETMMVVKEGLTIGGKSLHEHLEAINHFEAITLLGDWVKGSTPFNEYLLLQLHGLILRGIDRANAGRYRNVEVRITGSSHVPPQPYLVPKMMEDYFLFFQSQGAALHPVILAAEMHERLVSIHPFIDGNGRTARLVMNLILLSHGYPLVILKGDLTSRQQYYQALEQVQLHGETTLFHELVIERLQVSLKEHIELSKPGV